ncbi:3-oxoacyl-ACP reductase FabG [Verminephrobacter eiseniae]|uniref:SDR family NAD(P)-dependent oxidoreductase n=1 Tax=Verminephrobacter eiseniae TaxID=364317 RepID=UPI0022373CEF|nr:3-oxoacyl-ACP reductase family protein [Verminephrobacter eiseniae]MCW5233808.1 3-oxoacyl-ACP reductase FabG [Verminephrobacter eiseniae]MCW5261933.1 3-oxoacyl-ACP reductase FabG [Verminephrobacter eiseniae]
MSNLSGKTALVTGASRGIGAAIARRLAADGANVAITYKEGAQAAKAVVADIERLGRKSAAFKADAADPVAIQRAIDSVVGSFGCIDILVNNAGFMDASGTPLEKTSLEITDQTIFVNVRAPFLFAKGVAPHLSDGGRIINIGSCLEKRVPAAGLTLYAMTKAAMTGLTKGLARDLAGRGITVNQIAPGPIDTDMNPADGPNADFIRSLTSIGRFGKTVEIASIVAFLASSETAFITGADIAVDGGTNI